MALKRNSQAFRTVCATRSKIEFFLKHGKFDHQKWLNTVEQFWASWFYMAQAISTETKRPEAPGLALIVTDQSERLEVFRQAMPGYSISSVPLQAFLEPGFSVANRDMLVILECRAIGPSLLKKIEQLQHSSPCAVLVFADSGNGDAAQNALRAGASACVIDGFAPHRVEPLSAIARERFRQSQEARDEISRTKADLEARKLIERAKGLLMQSRGLSEQEAYALLRKTAMKQSRTIREVAESVLSLSDFLQ